MKRAFSTVELSVVLVILTVLTLVTVAKINVNNTSSTDIRGFGTLRMAVVKESSFYLTNSRVSTASELNTLISDFTVSGDSSVSQNQLSFASSSETLGLALKIKSLCYMLRKDYSNSEPSEVWSITKSGECSGERALETSLLSGRGETSSNPAVIG